MFTGICLLLVAPQWADAQVAGRGTVTIAITDHEDFSLQGVHVRISRADDDGLAREMTTSSTGIANFYYMEAGAYSVEIERLGYVPIRLRNVVVNPGERERLSVRLRESPPPVTEVDELSYFDIGAHRATAGFRLLSTGSDRLPLAPFDTESLHDLSSASLAISSFLPYRFVRAEMDGIPIRRAWAPVRGPGEDTFAAFPLSFTALAAFRRSPSVEGPPEGPGPLFEVQTPTGGSRAGGRVSVGGAWSGEGTGRLSGADAAVAPWFSGVISAPLQGDTIRVTGGLAFERLNRAAPTFLAPERTAAETLSEVGESWNGQAFPTATAETRERDVISGFSRLDWRLGDFSSLAFQLHGTVLPEIDPLAQPPLPEGSGTPTSGGDLFSGTRLLFASEGGNAMEINFGFGRSHRESGLGLRGGSAQGLAIATEGAMFGPFREDHGEFSITTLSLSPVATLIGDTYRLRAGGFGGVQRWSDQRTAREEERILLADAGRLGTGPAGGLRHVAVQRNRDLRLSQSQVGFFGEARWWIAPSLRVTLEGRVDRETLPADAIQNNQAWEDVTGIDRSVGSRENTVWSPGGEIRWEPPALPGWAVSVSGEMQPGGLDPALLGLVVGEYGNSRGIRELGPVERADAPRLYLLGPNFRAPRGELISMRLEGAPAPTLRIGIDLFRHRTDFLPRRRDLNLATGAGIVDQFQRAHLGQMVHRHGLITILPGSDRRFGEFDAVWALEADGWAETTGASIGATLTLADLVLEGNYTRSETRDNAPFGLTGFSNPVSGYLGPDAREAAWVEGRSDQDRPNRLSLVGTLELPQFMEEGTRISAAYRMVSGRPFTPGIRDALGAEWEEGWSRLQPIALPDGASLPSSGDGWTCERTSGPEGRLERNTCRGDAIHTVDLRMDLGLPSMGGRPLVLRIDALNLLDRGEVIRDPALFIVDGTRDLFLSPDGTRATLPVLDNPSFGEPIARLPGGRSVRFGLEYRF